MRHGQARYIADDTEIEAPLLPLVLGLIGFGEVLVEDLHEGFDLIFGAFPVLGGKRVEGHGLKTDVVAVVHDLFEDFRALDVAFGTGKSPLSGPPAVSVHDDADVLRQWFTLP